MNKVKKVRILLEGYGYENEEGGISLLATKPTKTVSIGFINESNEEKMEK